MGKLDGKVAVVTGAARGQGRSHAVTLARRAQTSSRSTSARTSRTSSTRWPARRTSTETHRLVEKEDRRCVTYQADVREPAQLREAVDGGVAELGHLDIVVANAGIAPLGPGAAR